MKIAYNLFFILPIILIIIIGLCFLQAYLSKKTEPFYGMILPTVFFVIGSWITLIAALNTTTNTNFGRYLSGIISNFLINNLLTIIFLLIYILSRKKLKLKKEIEKMNIIDLD